MARVPRLGEALGVVLLSASFFLALALLSHTPGDPSFFSHGAHAGARNLMGRAGATAAEAALQLFGLGSYFLAAAGFWTGARRVLGRPGPGGLTAGVAAAGILAGMLPLLHLTLGESLAAGTLSAGGLVGSLIGSGLVHYLNRLGGIVFSLTIMTVCAIVSTRVSFPSILQVAGSASAAGLRKARTAFARWSERRRKEKMRQRVVRKQEERQAAISRSSGADEGRAAAPPRPAEAPPAAPPHSAAAAVSSRRDTAPSQPALRPAAPASRRAAAAAAQPRLPIGPGHLSFSLPPTSLLGSPPKSEAVDDRDLLAKAKVLTEKCREFGVDGAVIEIHPGPVVTTFEFKPDAGVKYSKVTSLADDLCLAMEAESVRIDRISGKSTVGIEVPNKTRETIFMREVLESDRFRKSPSKLALAIGKRIDGEVYSTDLAKMPHLLIAGATGAGKSVTLNTIIASILFRATPDEVKFIFIDTKRLELGIYENIPHLLTPVVAEAKKASNALKWAVAEMERRYKLLAECGVRSIDHYNAYVTKGKSGHRPQDLADGKPELKPLPYIMVVIDELADLMILAARDVEESITRLAQMARAVGIHLVLSTQRPSVDVLTGVIKANLPSRIALRVSSRIDSRTIIDGSGAEKLLGNGDMLFLPPGSARLIRLHGSFITDGECQAVAEFLRKQAKPTFDESVIVDPKKTEEVGGVEMDSMFPEAVKLAVEMRQVSASHLQRRLRLGYARAARLVDMMEMRGIVGPAEGSKPREVLVDRDYVDQMAAG